MSKISEKIDNKNLLADAYLINGEWKTQAQSFFDVQNPSTGETIGKLPQCGASETEKGIEAAQEAFQSWSRLLVKERADYVLKWFDAVLKNKEDLAKILTLENGKPLEESRGEVLYAASFLRWFGEECRRSRGDVIPSTKLNSTILTVMDPIGVVGVITPWNFPLAMITRKMGAALASGCTTVVKPAEITPYSCIALLKLAEEVGIPKGVCNLVFGEAPAIGKTLCESKIVKKITFTGSTNVGKILMRDSASNIKKLSLELGGNAPLIVFDDADIDKAVKESINSKFRNAGQTCVCANRIYVHEKVYDEYAQKLTEEVKKIKVGDGFEKGVTAGPIINQQGFQKVKKHVEDAIEKGAKALTGGKPHSLGGNFFEPTVLEGMKDTCVMATEETFGPVAGLFKFSSEEEVLQRANNTEFGLAGYFFTENLGRAMRVAREMETGIVGVNAGITSSEVAPFGGIKESGLGKEGSHLGLAEFMEVKYILVGE